MKRLRALLFAGVVMTMAILPGARVHSATYYDYGRDYPPGGWNIPTAEIINRIGEVLAAIDSPQRRSELAQQWVQYSKQVIAKDQQFREAWLQAQQQRTSQMQEAEQLRYEIAKLQMRVEELRAENLRLEQQNLQMQMQLRPKTTRPAPSSTPTPTPDNSAPNTAPPNTNSRF